MWTGARLALSGDISPLFDWSQYLVILHEHFGQGLAVHNWSYPPHVLLFTWPLGLLPYPAALIVWDTLGLAAYGAAVSVAFGRVAAERRPWLIVAAVAAPVVSMNIVLGQVGLFVGALFISAWTLRARRPILAGVFIGLLTMKPHLGLLLPILLLVERRYLVILSAAVTTLILVVVTSLIFGWSVFADYIAYAGPTQIYVLTHFDALDWIMPTPMMIVRTLGLPIDYGWLFVAVAAPVAFVAFLFVVWKSTNDPVRFAMFGAATFLILPYAFTYDSTLLIVPVVLLLEQTTAPLPRLILLASYLLPLLGLPTAILRLPMTAVSLMALCGLLVHLTWRQRLAIAAEDAGMNAMTPHS